jgi:hypothetical protein
MKDSSTSAPIACSLTTAELRNREATLLAELNSAVTKTEELPQGYAFHLPGAINLIRLMAELIVAERECCPFLTFELTALPNLGEAILRITGPAGTKEFLRSVWCKST